MKMTFATLMPALLMSSAIGVVLAAPASAQTPAPTVTPAPTAQKAPEVKTEAQKKAEADKAAADKAAAEKAAAGNTGEGTAEELTTVTVTGTKATAKIDRDVYDPKTDPDTPVSSAADIMNKAPGVQVDPEGNVTLRGNSSVQVYINGKPSTRTQGDFRAATLQSMPADDIENIEVMTNPGAQYGSEGGAGIININLKRGRSLRPVLTMGVNVGSEGRYRLNINRSFSKGKFNFNGGAVVNHDARETSSKTDRERFLSSGTTRSKDTSENRNTRDTYSLAGGVEYQANENDTLSLQMNAGQNSNESRGARNYEETNTAGVVTNRYVSNDRNSTDSDQRGLELGFNHRGDKEGETFRADVRLGSTEQSSDRIQDYVNMDPTKNRQTLRYSDNQSSNMVMSADYTRPLLKGTFRTGFQLNSSTNDANNSEYNIDANGVRTLDARRTNTFTQDQDQYEFYGTVDQELSPKWSVIGGVRVETTHVSLNQKTTATVLDKTYTNTHPSFTVQYRLGENTRFRYMYSHRIQRPRVDDLNPFVVYYNELNARAGNPDLKPSETHANEFRYDYENRPKNFSIRAAVFYRKSEDLIIERSSYIENNVLLTRRENGGEGMETGLDLSYQAKFFTNLDVNLQAVLKHDERPARTSTFVNTINEQDSISGRASFGYRLTPKDRLQVTINPRGKELTGDGYRDASYQIQSSYGRTISNKLTFTASLNYQSVQKTFRETDTLRSFSENTNGGTTFMIGIRYNPSGVGGGRGMGGRGPGGGGNWGGGQGGGNGGGGNGPGGGF
ncbi:TonB-dependent receptor [Asticcacaulis sp. YBE204]|uniref:TonB-dependent receptor n=1 Tax=Asticcacaulis sp. YBE204 TaxID=1282363 RepID=UPI0003C3E712|nr:TonB-dependent receptor [Asticcacaulis sp. YBE204]ESQ78420.1 hypothetical protein AEYBE204_14710 [Asticcacaulis sp. YBE204]